MSRADIKVIKLYRKSIVEDANVTDAFEDIDNNGIQQALATDYFDVIKVEKVDSGASLMDIVDICNKRDDITDDNVAVQYYPMFCEETICCEYVKEIRKMYDNTQKKKIDTAYGNLFGDENNRVFLSIIQVHITPEVIARIENKDKKFSKEEYYYMDLHKIMGDFVVKYNEEKYGEIRFKIYKTISLGDFAIMIESHSPLIPFMVSSAIRKQSVVINERNYVLYKTYTMLSIQENVIEFDETIADEQFVIRACLSNKYWSEIETVNKWLSDNGMTEIETMYRLNGRYDLSLNLNCEEFKTIYPVICRYKKCSGATTECHCDKYPVVKYLKYMMDNGYFSYINERYLFKESGCDDVNISIDRTLDIETISHDEEKPFLIDSIKEYYDCLEQRIEHSKLEINKLQSYRKNVEYYMTLLHNILSLCSTIMALSETRINAYALMRQIDVVLQGLDEYIVNAKNSAPISNEYVLLVDSVEQYLRESVKALDSYAKYIRTNNLQTIQAPSYNVEGSVHLDKMLIGFGEFLNALMTWYYQAATKTGIMDINCKLHPILVPVMMDDMLSIEILFPNNSERQSPISRLMLVKCSTQRALTNIPEMVIAMFHEVAHQFRYENRNVRNKVLFEYCIHHAFYPVIQSICDNIKMEIACLMDITWAEQWLTESLIELFFEECKYEEFLKYPLKVFTRNLVEELRRIYIKSQVLEDIKRLKTSMLQRTRFELNVFDKNTIELIDEFCDSVESLSQANNSNEAEKALKVMSEKYGMLIEKTRCFKNDYQAKFFDEKIRVWMHEEFLDSFNARVSLRNLFEKLFNKLRKDYKSKGGLTQTFTDSSERLSESICLITRYLGIDGDGENNCEEFIKFMFKNMMNFNEYVENVVLVGVHEYREMASDLFMCIFAKLDAFGYLNFITKMLPLDSEIDSRYIKRFIYVICSICEKKDGFEKIYLGIQKGITKIINGYFVFFDENSKQIANKLRQRINMLNEDYMDNITNILSLCEELIELLDVKKCEGVLYDCAKELRHYMVICRTFKQILKEFNNLEFHMQYFGIMEDLSNGAKSLNAFYDSFEENFGILAKNLSRAYNDADFNYKTDVDFSQDMLKFIMDMYYCDKFKNAKCILNKTRR